MKIIGPDGGCFACGLTIEECPGHEEQAFVDTRLAGTHDLPRKERIKQYLLLYWDKRLPELAA